MKKKEKKKEGKNIKLLNSRVLGGFIVKKIFYLVIQVLHCRNNVCHY